MLRFRAWFRVFVEVWRICRAYGFGVSGYFSNLGPFYKRTLHLVIGTARRHQFCETTAKPRGGLSQGAIRHAWRCWQLALTEVGGGGTANQSHSTAIH